MKNLYLDQNLIWGSFSKKLIWDKNIFSKNRLKVKFCFSYRNPTVIHTRNTTKINTLDANVRHIYLFRKDDGMNKHPIIYYSFEINFTAERQSVNQPYYVLH